MKPLGGQGWPCLYYWEAGFNPGFVHRNGNHILVEGMFAKVRLFSIHLGKKLSDKGKPETALSRSAQASETYHDFSLFMLLRPQRK